jgi:hypothetical protein
VSASQSSVPLLRESVSLKKGCLGASLTRRHSACPEWRLALVLQVSTSSKLCVWADRFTFLVVREMR